MHRHEGKTDALTAARRVRAILVLLLATAAGCSTTPVENDVENDTTAPVLSGGMPSGMLVAGTVEATLRVTTDERAACTYSEVPNQPYPGPADMSADPSGTAHTATATGLQDGESYRFYVRCADLAGNATTADFAISFGIAATAPGDMTPPTLSNGQPSGALPAGTSQVTLRVTTDEPSTCRYALSPGQSFTAMPNTFATTGGTNHATEVGAQAGQNTFYVRCRDGQDNANGADFPISFVVNSGDAGPISAVRLAEGVDQDVNSVQTPSITPEPNALLLLWVSQTDAAGTNVATATGNNLQWELVATSVRSAPGPRRVSVLRAMSSSPTAGPVTINLGGAVDNVIWSITQHSGVSVSGANGSGAIAQVATDAAVGFETSALVTLGSASGDDNATIGAVLSGAAEPMTPGAGFLELSQDAIGMSSSGSFWMLVEFRDDFDASVDATWPTPAHWVAIGIELQTP
jgi:hypothetical protein